MRPARTLPVLDKDTHAFWTRGAAGELCIYRCDDCHYFVHPPVRFCPKCMGRRVIPQAVSGTGRVATFTVNMKQWVPELPVPYVLALIELDEQSDVRIATNLVNCAPSTVFIGMRVRVLFEQVEDVWVPLFEPMEST